MNTKSNAASAAVCSLLTLLLTACAPTTPEWDAQFGTAARLAMAQQIIDPHAATRAPSLQGIDGAAAREAIGRYRSTFKEPPPAANSFTIGVGR
jgi:type IV pilus biogenesis protein CpaD/CtpE